MLVIVVVDVVAVFIAAAGVSVGDVGGGVVIIVTVVRMHGL